MHCEKNNSENLPRVSEKHFCTYIFIRKYFYFVSLFYVLFSILEIYFLMSILKHDFESVTNLDE